MILSLVDADDDDCCCCCAADELAAGAEPIMPGNNVAAPPTPADEVVAEVDVAETAVDMPDCDV